MYILGRKDASWPQYALPFAAFLGGNFFRGYKIVGAGFLRPRANEQTISLQVAIGKMADYVGC